MKQVVNSVLDIVVTLALTALFVKLEDLSETFGKLANSFFNSNAFGALQAALHVDPNDADVPAFCCYALPGLLISIGIVYAGNRLFVRKSKLVGLVPVNRMSHGK